MNEAVAAQPIPLRELMPWAVLALVLVLQMYLVGFDQGAVSQSGNFLHELMHDGRHLLGAPCH
jgi:hypothetical protein